MVIVNKLEDTRNFHVNGTNGSHPKDLKENTTNLPIKINHVPMRSNIPVLATDKEMKVAIPDIKTTSDDESNTPAAPAPRKEFSEIFEDLEYNSEYILEIYKYTAKLEPSFIPSDYFSAHQHHVTEKMRNILIEWLVQIQEEFQLCHETLYRAVAIKDLFLSRTSDNVKMEEYQLIGSCCLWIASKYEEIYPPNLSNFAKLCDHIYSKKRFLQMEREIMRTIHFELNMPVPYTLSRVLNKIVDGNMAMLTLSRYICELTLINFHCCRICPSKIATACLYISMRMFQLGWSEMIDEFTGYTPEILKPEITMLNDILNESFHSKKKGQIRLKYAHPVFFKVAQKCPLSTSALF